jgi:arylsulfatase A-like enzyme
MSKKKPNIIIFNPDQWRGDVMGHIGNPAAHTPNLDKIVREDAISFQNAFCQNPVCTPSRCSFMTGWYPHTRGHRTMHYMLHPEHYETNLLRELKNDGYYVWWGGKNDLVPRQHGFWKHCNKKYNGILNYVKVLKSVKAQEALHNRNWRGPPEGDNYYSFFVGKRETEGDDPFYTKDWAKIQGAVKFIKNYKKNKPFCLYLPLSFPHPEYSVGDPWFSLIDRSKLPKRAPTPKNWEGKPSILKGIYENQRLQTWTEERWDELRATYYGMCAQVDDFFGQVVQALKESDNYDNTAIFFFADHGDYTGDYGLVEKCQNSFEDCLSKVPFIVKPPKNYPIKPRVSDALVELVDFSATVFEMTGMKPNYTSFGKSIVPLFDSDTNDHRDAAYCEGGRLMGEVQAMERESKSSTNPKGLYWPRVSLQITDEKPYHTKATMCRTKTHKYVRRLYEQDEYYDLTKDPQELHNEIDNPVYKDDIFDLKEKMLGWYQATCDVVPIKTDMR